MTVIQLIKLLREQDVKLSLVQGKLKANGPPGVLSGELLEQLKANKAQLIAFLEETHRAHDGRDTTIPVVAERTNPALSFAQQRLWFLDQLEPGNIAYNMPQSLDLQGPLAAATLERCLQEVITRHEVLRTTFPTADHLPRQQIAAGFQFALQVVDLRNLPARRRHAEQVAEAHARQPFDLARGPLLRALLLCLDNEDFLLSITMHHIISDGWSLEIFSKELTTLMGAFNRLQPSPLAPLPIQYADFSAWQRASMERGFLQRQRQYWLEQLGGELPLLALPADYARPARQSFRGNTLRQRMPAATSRALKQLAQRQEASSFMVMLTVFKSFLFHYSGQQDLLVGTPIANRNLTQIENLIGFFVNTLVLRSTVSAEVSFLELLGRIRETILTAFSHQDMPFDKLVEDLQPERSLSHSPLFQTMFLQQAPDELERDPADETPAQTRTTAKFDLTLALSEDSEGFTVHWNYNVDLFKDDSAARMLAHFLRLAVSFAEDPHLVIGRARLLDEAERRHMLTAWNPLAEALGPDQLALTRMRHQVRAAGDAVALVAPPTDRATTALTPRLTFAALWSQAEAYAAGLVHMGVGADVGVGLLSPRGLEMVAGQLAILMAGGTCIPMDPAYPDARLNDMLSDARPAVVLTTAELAARLPSFCTVMHLDGKPQPLTTELPPLPPPRGALAHLIYTSGSSGRPKGVMITQQGLAALLTWMEETFDATHFDGVLAATSLCFDLSIYEILGTLAMGGKVVLAENALHVCEHPARHEVHLINTVPSVMKELAKLGLPAELRTVNLAGEPLPRSLVTDLYGQRGITGVFNLYGPSEDTTYSTFCRVAADGDGLPPIGRPLARTRAYVLDRFMQPVPVLVPAELYLAGDGLARGYHQRPAQTAAVFVPDPFADSPGGRLYRTGDLTRYLANGQLIFCGRRDQQIKLRGHRIELAEVEAVLGGFPSLAEAVVLVRRSTTSQAALHAYVRAAEGATLAREDLLAYLAERLPGFMVPSSVHVLDRIPRLPNGKIDRRALPEHEQPTQAIGAAVPRNPLEEVIAAIFAQVLDLPRVGVHDNFFALGGHSLTATQVISRLRTACSVGLEVRTFFEHPSVAGLARQVEARRQRGEGLRTPALVALARTGPVEATFAQKRMWFLDRLGAHDGLYHIPKLLQYDSPLDVAQLEQALEAIVSRHETLRTRFRLQGETLVQVIEPEYSLDLTAVDLSELTEDLQEGAVQRLTRAVFTDPFDLASLPLLRMLVVRMGRQRHLLLVNLHHIIADAWSMGVLTREMDTLYQAGLAGKDPALPHLAIQYADFAAWQNQWLQGENLALQLDFWRSRLGGLPEPLELPLDHPRPALQTYRGHYIPFRIDGALRQRLRGLEAQGNTLFMILLAVFKVLLFRYSGQARITVGTPIANRDQLELEALIGFFVNTLVLQTDLDGNPAFPAVLDQVREFTLDAYAHQALPFEKLVQELSPNRDMSRSPLFQVMFLLQNIPGEDAGAAPSEAVDWGIDSAQAKFDLTLALVETREGLQAQLNYNCDLFEQATMQRFCGHYLQLLEAFSRRPGQAVAQAQLLSAAETNELLVTWNDTDHQPPSAASLRDLFERQAARTPAGIALVDHPQRDGPYPQLTYAYLERTANRLAHLLLESGLSAETPVGICMPRYADMITAILAVVKAGAAYVPLDPDYPPERLAFTLRDAGVRLVLSHASLRDRLPAEGVRVICEQSDWQAIAAQAEDNPRTRWAPSQISHIIYTSGSTGKPKGVLIPARGVVSMLDWARRTFSPAETRGVLAVTSICFDLSVFEIFLPLVRGGTVMLAGNVFQVPRLADRERISLINTVPSALTELLNAKAVPAAVKVVNLAGEPLRAALVRSLYRQTSVARVFNLYGPSEDTTYSTFASVDEACAVPPIGRPIDNSRAYVLDPWMQPQPIGVPGQLYLSGEGLARGYHQRPALTAQRFLADPFSSQPGSRLYASGDLVRYLPNGELVFLGRIDHQIKLRGFRIEMGEIESLLLDHGAVVEAHVTTWSREDDDVRLIAYVVLEPSGDDAPRDTGLLDLDADVGRFLKAKLPGFMVPNLLIGLAEMPKLPNGKIDRRRLPSPARFLEERPATVKRPPRSKIEQIIAETWQEFLQVPSVQADDNFFDLGGHSLLLAKVNARLEQRLDCELTMVELFQYPTVQTLAAFVNDKQTAGRSTAGSTDRARERQRRHSLPEERDVAIIGMAVRFPDARNFGEFRHNLERGHESVRQFSDEALRELGVPEHLLNHEQFVKTAVVLEDADHFDAAFFGFSPREAELMDPQHRLLLECAWEAMEHAGYHGTCDTGAVGVFAGQGMNTYLLNNLHGHRRGQSGTAQYQAMIANSYDFLVTRVSYKLDLKGPGVGVQSACSTSLLAIHLACQQLINGECDMAIAGGVSINVKEFPGYLHAEDMIFSPDGHCRAFDAKAQGTMGGDGVGLVVLKPLQAALADGDCIHAVIKGSAANNDGAVKVGYSAPSVEGQVAVISEALAVAGVDPGEIGYVEAHGTGTSLGDPIEVTALNHAFAAVGDKKRTIALGSVKTNFGHLNTAAGVAGLLKTVAALESGKIPASLNFDRPNPKIPFEQGPFYVNTTLADWPAADGSDGSDGVSAPCRAGVSSFGLGGTNVHVVLEEAPQPPPSGPARRWQLLVLSARTRTALDGATRRLAEHLREHPDVNLADVAFTLGQGRKAFNHRRALVCDTSRRACATLASEQADGILTGKALQHPNLVFMFPGGGAQYPNMGLDLYRDEPVYREHIDRCAELVKVDLGVDIRHLLFPDEADSGVAYADLKRILYMLPTVFSTSYALAKLWLSWGLEPQAMIGHSLGEYVAACLAGVFSLKDALTLVCYRGRLFEEVPPGAMMEVFLATDKLTPMLGPDISIAVHNGPANCVVSGTPQAVHGLERQLLDAEVFCRRLHIDVAAHSHLLDPLLDTFRGFLEGIDLQPPQRPYISNLTGTWISERQACDPAYWADHLRSTVRFGEGLQVLADSGHNLFLEVGPGRTLCTYAKNHPALEGAFASSSLRHPKDRMADDVYILNALGQLWLHGVQPDWSRFCDGARRRRLPLPTYCFDHQRFWVDPAPAMDQPFVDMDRQAETANWFYTPTWENQPLAGADPREQPADFTLIFADGLGYAVQLAERLADEGYRPILVHFGDGFERKAADSFTIDPGYEPDYTRLLQEAGIPEEADLQIVHAWLLTGPQSPLAAPERCLEMGFHSLVALVKAIGKQHVSCRCHFTLFTDGMLSVAGEPVWYPEKATLLGPVKVIPQENLNMSLRIVDLPLPVPTRWGRTRLLEHMASESQTPHQDIIVAYRNGQRWREIYKAVPLPKPPTPAAGLRHGGVYLITGGLGQVGLVLAKHLAATVQAKVVLTGRSEFPEPGEWDDYLSGDCPAPLRARIEQLLQVRELGGDVLYLRADVAEADHMQAVLTEIKERFGALHGVIHLAGIIGMETHKAVEELNPHVCRSQFRPKLAGSLTLAEVLADEPLDFCLLGSSTASLLGGLGFTTYAAANAFLNSFAVQQSQSGRFPWISVIWEAWRFGDWVESGQSFGSSVIQLALNPAEGAEVFAYLMAALEGGSLPGERLAISTSNLQARVDRWTHIDRETDDPDNPLEDGEEQGAYARPELENPYVAPENELERQLANIWQDLLNIREVGIHDNFFELGGDSMMATRVFSRLRETFKIALPLSSLFEEPTIAGLAELIETAREKKREPVSALEDTEDGVFGEI